MKIKFKDTLIKENLLTYVMILCALGGAITALFMGPVWDAFIWAFAAAITAFDLVLVDTLRLKEKSELKQEIRSLESNLDVLTAMHAKDQMKISELTVRVDDLRQQRSDYAAKYEESQAQLQATDNEYQKLAKEHNALGQQLSSLQKKYDAMVPDEDVFAAPEVPTTPPKPKKNPTTGTSKKAKYTKKDVARIREEMKAGGMIKEKDEE